MGRGGWLFQKGGDDMSREVLVHLNVRVPDDDTRTAAEIGDALLASFEVGSDDPSVENLDVEVALADDLGAALARPHARGEA